jgi:hypothetical protein
MFSPLPLHAAENTDYSFQPSVLNMPTAPAFQKFGIAAHPWWLDMFEDRFIAYYKDLKVTTVRLPFEWKVIEPQQGVYDWSREDRLLHRLNDEGFEVVAEFVTIPPWASLNKSECVKEDFKCKPNPNALQDLAKVTFASIKRYPFVRNWEFWNEPDLWPYMGSRDISDYAYWLKGFYDAAKRADPTVYVAATSLSGKEYTDWLYRYCDMVYGMRPWDAVAYHPYNLSGMKDPENGQIMNINKTGIEALRNLMVEMGDAKKPIWLTEVGWTGTPQEESLALLDAFAYVQQRPYLTMLHVHMLHDWEGEKFGLLKVKGDLYGRTLGPNDEFLPKQPYYDTYRVYNKRILPAEPEANSNVLVFPQTGHTVRDVFKRAWEKGGLELFGYPKTGQFYERNSADGNYYLVQYFERVRMEYHPEFKGTISEVLFGLLGNQVLLDRGWVDKSGQPLDSPAMPEEKNQNTYWFPDTQHNLSGLFLQAWFQQGGLAIIGLPKTRVYDEANPDDGGVYKVQYFERARMELHPGANGQPDYILFGLLGNERLRLENRLLSNNQPNLNDYYNPALPEFG